METPLLTHVAQQDALSAPHFSVNCLEVVELI